MRQIFIYSSKRRTKDASGTADTRRRRRVLPSMATSVQVLFVLALLTGRLVAQEPLKLTQLNHTSWTAREGAPSEIAGLGQTPDGILWVGGGGGLFRFDGNTFSLFNPAPGEPPLPRISATALCVARDGTVWVGFRPTGMAAIKDGHVTNYGAKDGLPPNTVLQLLQGPDGTMWAVIRQHLMHLHAGRWSNESTPTIESERVYKIFFDKAGTQWVATNNRIYRRPRGQTYLEATNERGGEVVQFAESPDGSLWMAGGQEDTTEGWVRQIDVEGHRSPHPFLLNIQPDDLSFDREGMLWIAAEDGVWRVTPRGHTSGEPYLIERFGRADGLSSEKATRMLEDASGDTWVGTMRGLERFKQPKLISPQGLPVSDSRMIVTSCGNGDVWAGVPDAPLVSIQDGRTVVRIRKNKEISSLYCDQRNVIWFTDDAGIGRFDGRQTNYIPLPQGLPPSSAKQVVRADDGSIFVPFRNAGGLWRWSSGNWSRVLSLGLPIGTQFVIFRGKDDRIWAGYANDAIGMLEGGSGHTFECPGLGDVTVFAETSYGFFAGGMNGIAFFDGQGFRHLPFEDANHVRGISGLVESEDGDLWLNGSYGVVRVPKAEAIKALGSQNYRMNAEIITEGNVIGPAPLTYAMPSAVRGAKETIWFSSSSKAIYVDPKRFPRNPVPPMLTISSIAADGRILSDYGRIAAGVNTLIIKYAGVNLTAPERVTYRYKLDGSDNTWQEVGTRSEAVYTRLRPGNYKFHIRASNGEGGWSESSTSEFTILPAFYQTPWFVFLCAAMIIASLWLALMARLRRISERVRIRAEERAEERVRIARDLHDTLLQGVQGLMLRVHVAAQEVPEGARARDKLEQALKAADTVLLEGRDRVRSLRANSLNDLTLAEALEGVGAHFIHHDHIAFRVLTEGATTQLDPLVLEEAFCIGREAITNAFQHARATSINVTISYCKNEFRVSCKDNGGGIPPDVLERYRKEGHWGLVGMKERAERIGAIFECKSSPAQGTLVTLSVPAIRAFSEKGTIRGFLWDCRRILRL
jgi:signal transduction histidine kinase/ligand-binding sensor domain-containing protein